MPRNTKNLGIKSADELKVLINYDPETGIIRATSARPNVPEGKILGSRYFHTASLHATLNRRQYYVHRLLWLYFSSALEGHLAYVSAAIKYFGEFARAA